MPIYEYSCQTCGKDCELLIRSVSARPVCPRCGSRKLSRKFSMFFAGGGRSRGSGSSCAGCTSSHCSTCRR